MEQPLLPYESCILGAINLSNMIKDKKINYKKLKTTIKNAVKFLDNAINKNKYPFEELEKESKKYRKIGIGVMGWAELLIRLDIRYGGDRSLELAEELSSFIYNTAVKYSEELAQERGVFDGFDNTTIEKPRRNAVLTTVAPTGSRSFIANTSGGIEPFYDIEGYTHTDADGNITDFKFDFMKGRSERVLVGALDISPEDHVRMQSAWQKNVDSAVSKTVNLPENATKQDVGRIYKLAYETGCKGITIYRNNSKTSQVLNNKNENNETKDILKRGDLRRGDIEEAPKEAPGKRYKMQTGCGTLYFIPIFDDEGNLIEIFNSTSNGGCTSFTEATSRMISLALRSGVSLEEVIEQLHSINPCPAYQYRKAKKEDTEVGSSCPSAIANKLKKYVNNKGKVLNIEIEEEQKEKSCPECGADLQMESGCKNCSRCGWSKCS